MTSEKITPREKSFPDWYQDIVIQARLADYSPVKGCMVIRPNGYSIWETIQREFDKRIKALGVSNAYFPVFIPESFLQKEAEHVEGFAPECAVVSHAGGKELEEKFVVRPTSETIINSMFSKWVQSYRDLPLMINQWANVVRWEMRTRLFLRTTEFLWQEGHTCHATAEESNDFAIKMIRTYVEFMEDVLAIPVYAGRKSENEKFPGALNTFTMEAMMQDCKALQAGTSHDLSTNFAKAFNTRYLAKEGKEQFVHQTSWGVSTRLIGGLIMTHSDDKGLVLPPRVARNPVVIVPVYGKAAKDPEALKKINSAVDGLREQIEKIRLPWGEPVSVKVDQDDTKQPGWKFHEYELIGIPVRLEMGPRDLDKKQVVVYRRDTGKKDFVPLDQAASVVEKTLAAMQTDLYQAAMKRTLDNTFEARSYDDFKSKVAMGFVRGAFCMDSKVEDKVKEETKATLRLIELDKSYYSIKTDEPCMITGKKGPNTSVIFARSY